MGATRSASADAILSAAQQMIRERGPEKLRLAAVAEAAGVSRQTLYRWFPTKDDLLAAISQRERALFDDRLNVALAVDPPAGAPARRSRCGSSSRTSTRTSAPT